MWICEVTSLSLAEFSLDSGTFPALTSAACRMTSWTAWNTIQTIHLVVKYIRVNWVLTFELMNNHLKSINFTGKLPPLAIQRISIDAITKTEAPSVATA
jgi:hypothetical protein